MTVGSIEATDRRAESLQKLHTLLETRKETLTILGQLASMRPFKPDHDVQLLLQEFCEVLVDYTASAHFQLYRFIEEGTERRQPVKEVAAQVYPRIAETTAQILDFNDNYDCEDHCDDLSGLAEDLSKLGESLADRITLEDKLIAVLMAPKGK